MNRKRGGKQGRRFETAGVSVLGQAQVRRARSASRVPARRLWAILILSLVVVAAGALWLTCDKRFYVSQVDVLGATRSSPERILEASGLPRLHVLWVRPAEVEARILADLHTIESARVTCRLTGRCTVAVTERQPRVVWDEDGRLWWVDADGVVFPAPDQETGAGAWLVRGPLPRDEDDRLDERVRVALNELWAVGGDMPSSLAYVVGRGFVFTDRRGWRVIVGQGPGMARRLQVLECLAADLQARGLMPRFVDVRFADAPYYSLTNEW